MPYRDLVVKSDLPGCSSLIRILLYDISVHRYRKNVCITIKHGMGGHDSEPLDRLLPGTSTSVLNQDTFDQGIVLGNDSQGTPCGSGEVE